MIAVQWKGGEEKGFSSRKAAERFIERIGKKLAPNKSFSITESVHADIA
jgi:hypothetical protein